MPGSVEYRGSLSAGVVVFFPATSTQRCPPGTSPAQTTCLVATGGSISSQGSLTASERKSSSPASGPRVGRSNRDGAAGAERSSWWPSTNGTVTATRTTTTAV